MSDRELDSAILMFGQNNIARILTLIASVSEPSIFAFTEDVEAFEKQGGGIPGARSIPATIVALEGLQESVITLIAGLVTEVGSDISKTISVSVRLKKKAALYPDSVPQGINITDDIELANRVEVKVISDIGQVLDPQVEKIAGLIQRLKRF